MIFWQTSNFDRRHHESPSEPRQKVPMTYDMFKVASGKISGFSNRTSHLSGEYWLIICIRLSFMTTPFTKGKSRQGALDPFTQSIQSLDHAGPVRRRLRTFDLDIHIVGPDATPQAVSSKGTLSNKSNNESPSVRIF